MKKLIAIAASAVMAMGVFALAACGGGNGGENQVEVPKTPDGFTNYEDKDLSTEEKKGEFLEEVATKIDYTKLFDAESVSLAANVKVTAEVAATLKDFPTLEGETEDLALSANVTLSESAWVNATETSGVIKSVTNAKGNVSIPDSFFTVISGGNMDADSISAIQSIITNFDYTMTEYTDGEYAYIELPMNLFEKFPEEAETGVPEGGKIKVALGGSSEVVPGGDVEDTESSVDEEVDYPDSSDGMSSTIGAVIDLIMSTEGVTVATSTDAGYSLRVTASAEAVMSIVSTYLAMDVEEIVAQYADITEGEATIYFAVDEDGAFQQFSVDVNVEADLTLANVLPFEIEGSAKLGISLGVVNYDGVVSLPDDLDSYVDVNA